MEYIKEFTQSIPECARDIFCSLIKTKVIDSNKIRNAYVIKDFDKRVKENNCTMEGIYKELSDKYCISRSLVRFILSHRKHYNFC